MNFYGVHWNLAVQTKRSLRVPHREDHKKTVGIQREILIEKFFFSRNSSFKFLMVEQCSMKEVCSENSANSDHCQRRLSMRKAFHEELMAQFGNFDFVHFPLQAIVEASNF